MQMGISKKGIRDGEPLFHGSLKAPVKERMLELYQMHNDELA